QVIGGDFCELLLAAARGELGRATSLAPAAGRHAVCVTLAAPGYPAAPRLGEPVRGLDAAAALPGVHVYHAGTQARGGQTLTAGGRVFGVTGVGQTLEEAHERAYRAADVIDFEGKQLRRDIAHAGLQRSGLGAPAATR